ncbi:MAG: ATP-binding protein [Trueperaceae bacterium]
MSLAAPRLIDREQECRELQRLLEDGSPKLALLTGRRRVGKTFLLTHAWGAREYFLFTASRVTGEANRHQFLKDLAAWSGEEIRGEDYPTWRTVFNLILDLKSPQPLVVVLDEFQYLAEDGNLAEVASELNAAWERKRPQRPLLLVLSGSAVNTMEGLAGGGAPLYGRFAWQHRLQPFTYWHAAELAPFADPRDRATAYGVFGGTPRYLAAIDSQWSLAENIQNLLLAPTGEVRTLVETALDQEEGLRDVAKYRSILRAVAQGRTLRNEIADVAGLENNHAFRLKLERLIELGYLETHKNIDARASEPVRYYVADPAFRFYQRFVEPNTSTLERYEPAHVWEQAVESHLDTYMGHEFERIARQAYDRFATELDLPLVEEWGRWEGKDRNGDSLEIDIVSPLLRGGILTGSIKWNRRPIGPDVHWTHLDMLERAGRAGRKWAHRALEGDAPILYVAAGGFTPAFNKTIEESEWPVALWTLRDIYRQ